MGSAGRPAYVRDRATAYSFLPRPPQLISLIAKPLTARMPPASSIRHVLPAGNQARCVSAATQTAAYDHRAVHVGNFVRSGSKASSSNHPPEELV
jgi:hypothetical protein